MMVPPVLLSFSGKPKATAEKVGKCPRLALGIVTFVATIDDR